MRHFAKLFSCPATMLSSSLVLSSLNGETIRRLGSKRYYFEEPNKSLTLRERGLPTMAGMGLAPGSTTVEKHSMGVKSWSQCNGKELLGGISVATSNSQCRRRGKGSEKERKALQGQVENLKC